jgi:hypothetical protein
MSLFKKVMIIGLATMALGSAAMGAPKDKQDGIGPTNSTSCSGISDLQVPPAPGVGGGNLSVPGSNSTNPINQDAKPSDS